MPNQIRPLAIYLFRDGDRILVGEGNDPVKRETFYRPLGGGIEFGPDAPLYPDGLLDALK